MADKVSIEDLGLNELQKILIEINKQLNVNAESMSHFIDEAMKLKTGLDSNNLSKFTETQAELNKTYQQGYDISIKLEKLNQEKIRTQSAELKLKQQIETQQKKNNKTDQDFETILKRETKSIQDMQDKVRDLNKARKQLDLTTAEGNKKNQEAIKIIDNLNKHITANSDAETKRYKTIGKYKEGIIEASKELQNSIPHANKFMAIFSKFGAFGAGIAAGAALISAPFIAFFKSFDDGMDMAERKVAGFKESMAVLQMEIGRLGQKIVGNQDSAIKWGNALEWVARWMGGIANIFPGFNKWLKETKEKMNDASKAGEEMTLVNQQLEDSEIAFMHERSKSNRLIAEAKLINEDETKSQKERILALETVLNSEININKKEIELQDKRVKNIELEKSLKKERWTEDDERKLQEAIVRKDDLETQSLIKQRKLQSAVNAEKKKFDDLNEARALKELETKKSAIDEELEKFKDATTDEKVLITLSLDNKIKAYNDEVNKAKIKEETKQKLLKETAKISKDIDRQNEKDIEEIAKKEIDKYTKLYQNKFNEALQSGEEIDKAEELFLKNELNRLDTEIEASNLSADEKIKAHERVADARRKLDEENYRNFKKWSDRETKEAEKRKDKIISTHEEINSYIQESFNVASGLLENQTTTVEQDEARKLAAVDSRLTMELKAAGDNEERKAKITARAEAEKEKIQKDFAIKKAQIERKQAIFEKAAAIVEIGIQTAINTVKAFPNPFLMALAIALGLAQEAVVITQPLPEIPQYNPYAKGRKAKPYEEIALVSEEGREGLKKNGKYIGLTPDVPTIMNIPAGIEIEPHKATERELARFDGAKTENIEIIQLNNSIQQLIKVNKNQPKNFISMTANSFRIHAIQGFNKTEYRNRTFKHKKC
jgi:hypothetical protein